MRARTRVCVSNNSRDNPSGLGYFFISSGFLSLEINLLEDTALPCPLQRSPHSDEQPAHNTCSTKIGGIVVFQVDETQFE